MSAFSAPAVESGAEASTVNSPSGHGTEAASSAPGAAAAQAAPSQEADTEPPEKLPYDHKYADQVPQLPDDWQELPLGPGQVRLIAGGPEADVLLRGTYHPMMPPIPSLTGTAPAPIPPPPSLQQLLMAWYWCGYYAGHHDATSGASAANPSGGQ